MGLNLVRFDLGRRTRCSCASRTLRQFQPDNAVLYFEVVDIHAAYATLKENGVEFDEAPHLIFRDEKGTFAPAAGEEWRAFFKHPDGNVFVLASRIAPQPA